MRSGTLRHRIELQKKVETRDLSGGTTRNWATSRTVWAQILPLRGQERFEAQQVEARTSMKIRIRFYGATVSYSIAGVNITAEEFVVAEDQTVRIVVGDTFKVVDSTANDGTYTVKSTSYAAGPNQTTIEVNEDITDATVDGTILHAERLDATWRAKKGQRIFNIAAVLNITEKNITHELLCTETMDEQP